MSLWWRTRTTSCYAGKVVSVGIVQSIVIINAETASIWGKITADAQRDGFVIHAAATSFAAWFASHDA